MTALDKRLNAYREDLADQRLFGKVVAERFTEGAARQLTASSAGVRSGPRRDAALDTEALYGERLTVFDEAHGWAWVQLAEDGYAGYVRSETLGPVRTAATHRVTSLRTFVYLGPNIKTSQTHLVSTNARLAVVGEEGRFFKLDTGGYVVKAHAAPLDRPAADFVAVAERFIGVPYLWGGKTSLGLDCSGLVQTALHAAGLVCPRDTDMQEAALGKALPDPADLSQLERGDLVFWAGHAGIMADAALLVHSNGYHMEVVKEPVAEAVARIAAEGKPVTSIKRLPALSAVSETPSEGDFRVPVHPVAAGAQAQKTR